VTECIRPSRRAVLKMAAAGAGGVLLPARKSHGDTSMESRHPNIVFIIADDMGWSDVGYHGSEVKTPNIDRLAGEGVRFDQHYATPTCTPTRVGLMTGRYPSRYGVLAPAYGDIFDDGTVTVASALSASGYDTAISGKWHMGSPPDCVPRKYGFKHSYGYFDGQIDPYTHLYKTGRECWHRNDELVDEEGHATDLITREAVRVIESASEAPFYLYVAYSVPHYPLAEPERWTAMYEGVMESESRRWFAASISHMDDGIGRIVEALDRVGKRGDTLVVFVSDNGGQRSWHNEEHYKGRYADKPHDVLGDNRPLRGWKGQVYEGGIRVPALANWPGALKPGRVQSPVHIVDWTPTLCGLADHTSGRDLAWDGRDIWSLIQGKEAAPEPRTLYWKTPKAQALRQGDWKLVVGESESPEMYDLASAPYEKRDLAEEQPKRVAEMKALMAKVAESDRER
jgi:arylsulfatase B